MFNDLFEFLRLTGFPDLTWQMPVMWAVCVVLLYLAVYRGFEPLLLVPIAFGALLANLPGSGLVNEPPGPILSPVAGTVIEWKIKPGDEVHQGDLLAILDNADPEAPGPMEFRSHVNGRVTEVGVRPGDPLHEGEKLLTVFSREPGGLFYYLSRGIEWEIFPPLIFLESGRSPTSGRCWRDRSPCCLGRGPAWGGHHLPRRDPRRLHGGRERLDRDHRRSGRPHRDFSLLQAGAAPAARDRRRRLQLHGARAAHPAAHHARPHLPQ